MGTGEQRSWTQTEDSFAGQKLEGTGFVSAVTDGLFCYIALTDMISFLLSI